MKKLLQIMLAAAALLAFMSCATSSYDTARYREGAMAVGRISMSGSSFSNEQLESILATSFPPHNDISLAVYYLTDKNNYYHAEQFNPLPSVIEKLQTLSFIERIVPVPDFLLPKDLNIDALQQLGIRTLSEYSLIIYGESRNRFFSYKTPAGYFMISSSLEFILLDNRTTAIIAADKLMSEKETKFQAFSDKARTESLNIMYTEQALLLKEKMEKLFLK